MSANNGKDNDNKDDVNLVKTSREDEINVDDNSIIKNNNNNNNNYA